MAFIYNSTIYLYLFLIRISTLFNQKARIWISGRKGLFQFLQDHIDENSRYVWFHAASLGEFEQGRPVIEKFRNQFPGYKIILTFFSPSGYEIRKNYNGADIICYLPIDTPGNAERFISLVQPVMAVFIKYEFWFNYLQTLQKKHIPVLVISAIFREEQHFFKTYGGWFRKRLQKLDYIFVQNEHSLKLLESIGLKNVQLSGDTRFDRVAAIANDSKDFPAIRKFTAGKKVLLAGSSWPVDEKFLQPLLEAKLANLKLIIAPHEIHEEHIRSIESLFSKYNVLRYSKAKTEIDPDTDVLIIDSIGYLSHLYQYCDVAYIGGGFGKGIHNILEAVTFGKPVIFGINYRKFGEAVELVALGGAFAIGNQNEFLERAKQLLIEDTLRAKASEVCLNYIRSKKGATEIIIRTIEKVLK